MLLRNRSRLTDLENKLVVFNGDSGGCGEITQEFGINTSILLYIKQVNDKHLLYNKGNCIQYLVITCNRKESEKLMYTHTQNRITVHLNVIEYCKLTMLQFKKWLFLKRNTLFLHFQLFHFFLEIFRQFGSPVVNVVCLQPPFAYSKL